MPKLYLKDSKSGGEIILKRKHRISFHFPNPNLLLALLNTAALSLSLWIYLFRKVKNKRFIWTILKFW